MIEPDQEHQVPGDLELRIQSAVVRNDIAIVVLTRGGPPIEYPLKYHPRYMDANYEQKQHLEIIDNRTRINWPYIGLTLSAIHMFNTTRH